MTEMSAFIRGMPKTELHMHIEGSLESEMMFASAERNGIK
jgi:adenine deaminase